jgi:hypothetical protein
MREKRDSSKGVRYAKKTRQRDFQECQLLKQTPPDEQRDRWGCEG